MDRRQQWKIYGVNGKWGTAKHTECTTIRKKKSYEHRPSEPLFPSYGLPTMNENVQNVHVEFSCRQCRRKTSGDPTSFHYIWLGLCTMISYTTMFQSHYKMRIRWLGFIYGSCMTLFCIFSCSSEGLCAQSSFSLYSHVDSPSVVLAVYFLFTLYQNGK
jgi:hypothetical protein